MADDSKTWIIARLDDDGLKVALYGSTSYMDEDPIHRTRTVTAHLDLSDETALRSARSIIVPRTPGMSESTLDALEQLREKSIPDPKKGVSKDVQDALKTLLDDYADAMRQLLRRAAIAAEASAYRLDSYDEDGNPVVDESTGLSGSTRRTQ
jgi:hypothetical protein